MSLLLVDSWPAGRVRSVIAATIDLAIPFLGLRLRLVQALRTLFPRLAAYLLTQLYTTILLVPFEEREKIPCRRHFFIDSNAGKAKSFSTPGSSQLFHRFKSTYIPFIYMDILDARLFGRF